MSHIEDTIERIKNHSKVEGILIVNSQFNIIKSTFDQEKQDLALKIAKSIPQLAIKARSTVREIDPTNDLMFLRIKTKNFEIMVAPDKDFFLIVQSNTKDKKEQENEQ